MSSKFLVEKLNAKAHNRIDFDCGNKALNYYLVKQASQDQRKSLAVVYVATDAETTSQKPIYGYYTLSTYAIDHEKIAQKHTKHITYESVPCVLIGRLAVNKKLRKIKGFELLGHALIKIKEMANKVGIRLVIVDAKDETARSFYRNNGFFDLLDNSQALYYPLASIKI